MVKAVKYSTIAQELKKEYLKEHLEDVKNLISNWIPQLIAPEPLSPNKGAGGLQPIYRPPTELEPDNSHILRRHLRSRALWSHHANWERKLDSIWDIAAKLCEEASNKYGIISKNTKRQYTDDYVTVALWRGFDLAYGGKFWDWYKVPDDKHGVSYGAYKVELSAKTSNKRSLIISEHRDFIKYIAELYDMNTLIELWKEVAGIQERMQSISIKALKSRDILYPCTLCKHLWK